MHHSACQPGRPTRLAALFLVLAVLVSSFPAAMAQDSGTQAYVGHRARLSAEIPSHWSVPEDGSADYAAGDGFVYSTSVRGDDLAEACNTIAAGGSGTMSVGTTTWNGDPACRVEGELLGRDAVGLVMSHPQPFTMFEQEYAWVALLTDPEHFPAIIGTVSFDQADVSPQDYAFSVLDLLEARAWYAPEVDWDALREDPLGLIANAQTYEETHWVIRDGLNRLQAWGDNHSLFFTETTATAFTAPESTGTGMILQGRSVWVVYPDSPSGRADIRVGDTIEAVNGEGFNGTRWIEDAVGTGATLEISRPGVTEPITVEIEPGPYSRYLPPIVETVGADIGYVELFSTIGADEVTYATDANEGIARVDDPAMCGWIIDLRRNGGGSYGPMVLGVGSIVGEGELFSFERRDGEVVERIELREGRFYRGDQDFTGPIANVPIAELDTPVPPVAVLIGPGTGSAAEVTAVAFIGRSETRLFGETSFGLTIGNNGYALFDGASLRLAESTYVDRTGGTHIGGIQPDVFVAIEWETYGTPDDPVIQAASSWLREQPGCAEATPAS